MPVRQDTKNSNVSKTGKSDLQIIRGKNHSRRSYNFKKSKIFTLTLTELGTFVLGTHNSNILILISKVGTFEFYAESPRSFDFGISPFF